MPYRLGRGGADSEPIAVEAIVEINPEKLMFEWVLLFVLTLKTTPGGIRDISPVWRRDRPVISNGVTLLVG